MANCTVSGTFVYPQGSAISGATVRFNLQTPVVDASGNLLMPKEVTTTTASDGTWSLSLVQSIAGNLTLDLNPTSTSPVVKYFFSLVIPALSTASFASCWADSSTFGGQGSTTPLTFSAISGTLATAQLPSLPSSDIWVGNGSALATPVAVSGDASLSSSGAVTINTVGTSSSTNIHTAELLANAATASNTASTILKRDGSGQVAATTFTGALAGNATTSTTAGSFSGSLVGDVTGTQVTTKVVALQGTNVANTTPSDSQILIYNNSQSRYNPASLSGDVSTTNAGVTAVGSVGGSSASNVHTAELLANAATNANTVSTIVKRDSSGNFSAGTITASLSGNATTATSATSATTATTATNFSGSLSGDVTGTQGVTAVAKINGTTVSGTTGSGNVVFSTAPTLSSPIVGTQGTSDNSTKAASTAYVTTAIANAVAGVNPAVAVQAATTAASDTSGLTYTHVAGIGDFFTGSNNTAITVDGYTFTAINQRLLVKNDTQSPSGAFNGVYYVTQVQTAILPPILTRALDFDTSSDINNTGAIPVINGTVNGTTQWVVTSTVTTVGTDPITFAKFSRNPADYLLVASNLSDVATPATAFNNISPITTTGDLVIGNGTNSNTRLAKGTQYQTLQTGASTLAYDAVHLDQSAAVTGVLPNANTTAVSTNTASTIVTRDGSGNFSAGTITAALTGIASGNTTYTASNHGVVVSGSGNAMTVIAPDSSATKVLKSGGASADPSWLAYDNANTVSTLVARDSSGNFSAGTITASLTGNATNVTSTVVVAHGGTGLTTLTANNVLLGNGTGNVQLVSPGSSGNVLTSDGTTWSSTAAGSGPVVNTSVALITAFYSFS